MRLAHLFNLAFSAGGLLILLLLICAWLLIRPRSGLVRSTLVFVVLWYTALSTYPIPHGLNQLWSRGFPPLEKSRVPPGSAAIVLLGSGSFTVVDWFNNRAVVPDPIGLARALEAARLYRLLGPAWVISSGGLAEPGTLDIPPGEAMKDVLVRLGVPPTRIIVKSDAIDTHDEAQNVMRLLPTLHVDHVVLVTSGVHVRRATATFRAAGIPVIPAPAREEKPGDMPWRTRYLPSQRGLFEASIVAHEMLGFVYYKLKAWL